MNARTISTIAGVSTALTLGIFAATSTPDPEMKLVLDALGSLGGKPIETLSPAEARKQPTPADAVKRVLQQQGKTTAPEPVGNVENRTISGPGGPIPIRIECGTGAGHRPVVAHLGLETAQPPM